MDRLHRRLLPGRHWYLVALGVAPGRQRQGMGSSLLLPVLAEAEAMGLPCYLETTNRGNLSFYARFRFVVTGEEEGPGGLHIWAMVRPPSPGGG